MLSSQVYDTQTSTGKWIARDGSAIDYGEINGDNDFYDPDGKQLFGDDDDPDDEEYEGFTGNTGWHSSNLTTRDPRSPPWVSFSRIGLSAY